MSQVTFSKDLGILEAGCDYNGFLGRSTKTLDYFASVHPLPKSNPKLSCESIYTNPRNKIQICQVPMLDYLFDKNPIMRIGPPTFVWANLYSIEQLQARHEEATPTSHIDFLAKFLEVKKKHPELVNDDTVILYLLSNVLAGSDSTAGALCATIYHVLKHPAVHKKLVSELRDANLTLPAKWKDINSLTYLEAVMRESMRLNPGVGLILERVVPKGGFTLPDGRYVPEGTVVGMNPWVISRNGEIFGADTETFIPERWLKEPEETDEVFQARVKKMKAADMAFGAGSRACLGRYLSQLESYKLIATLFSAFDVSFLLHLELGMGLGCGFANGS